MDTYASNIAGSVTGDALPILGFVGAGPGLIDALDVADTFCGLKSEQARARAGIGACDNAYRYMGYLTRATPDEAADYLRFDRAATRLLQPTKEEVASRKAVYTDAAKSAPWNASGSVATDAISGIKLAGHAGTAISAVGMDVSGAFSIGTALADLYHGAKELALQQARKKMAQLCRLHMAEVGKSFAGHPQGALLDGIILAMDRHQCRLINRADGEKGFAKLRIFKGSVGLALGIINIAIGALIAAGIVAALASSIVGGIGALPLLLMAGALIVRAETRHGGGHTAKWRQRAACVVSLTMPRDALEQAFAADPERPLTVQARLGEGDYIAKDQCFKTQRLVEFEACDNEYLALMTLALQVQDGVQKGFDPARHMPFVQLLRSRGFNSVKLLALCQAAAAMPPDRQLDYIQAELAPLFGVNFRTTASGAQALAHASVFLEHFQHAWLRSWAAFSVNKVELPFLRSEAFLSAVLDDLRDGYADPEAGMAAFMDKANEFLILTQDDPGHSVADGALRKELQRFYIKDLRKQEKKLDEELEQDPSLVLQAELVALQARLEDLQARLEKEDKQADEAREAKEKEESTPESPTPVPQMNRPIGKEHKKMTIRSAPAIPLRVKHPEVDPAAPDKEKKNMSPRSPTSPRTTRRGTLQPSRRSLSLPRRASSGSSGPSDQKQPSKPGTHQRADDSKTDGNGN